MIQLETIPPSVLRAPSFWLTGFAVGMRGPGVRGSGVNNRRRYDRNRDDDIDLLDFQDFQNECDDDRSDWCFPHCR